MFPGRLQPRATARTTKITMGVYVLLSKALNPVQASQAEAGFYLLLQFSGVGATVWRLGR